MWDCPSLPVYILTMAIIQLLRIRKQRMLSESLPFAITAKGNEATELLGDFIEDSAASPNDIYCPLGRRGGPGGAGGGHAPVR